MRVAVLGTGIMGAPMARNLAAAGTRSAPGTAAASAREPLAEHGVRSRTRPTEAVEDAEVVVTMLSDGAAVEAWPTGSRSPRARSGRR